MRLITGHKVVADLAEFEGNTTRDVFQSNLNCSLWDLLSLIADLACEVVFPPNLARAYPRQMSSASVVGNFVTVRKARSSRAN